MKYYIQHKGHSELSAQRIKKEEARINLTGYWDEESLDDIFENDRQFCLYTPYAYIYTKTDDGGVPMPGFFGIVG